MTGVLVVKPCTLGSLQHAVITLWCGPWQTKAYAHDVSASMQHMQPEFLSQLKTPSYPTCVMYAPLAHHGSGRCAVQVPVPQIMPVA